jgi:hypothetical protein
MMSLDEVRYTTEIVASNFATVMARKSAVFICLVCSVDCVDVDRLYKDR